jgi:hypothetical protein
MTPLETALSYIKRGWNPVPLAFRSKGGNTLGKGWQHRVITAETAPRFFDGEPQNVGVQLGTKSKGLTDVDLDCAEAIAIAPYFLPRTKAIFGRASKRNSHYLFVTDLGTTTDAAVFAFDDPDKATKDRRLLELRVGAGDLGAQTVFPGSVHVEGEPIKWEEDGEPAKVAGADLHRTVRQIAAYSLLARRWPAAGNRHTASLVLGGFLSRAGLAKNRIGYAVEVIAKAARDEEWKDRRRAAEDAASAEKRCGLTRLRELFGREVADKIAEWLDYRGGEEREHPAGEEREHPTGIETQPDSAMLESTRASNIKMAAIQWLWPDRFALGKLGLLVGLPDEGKGQILADMAARVTRGDYWPCNEGRSPQGNVILLSAEDDPGDTVVPRLTAAGGELDRIEIVKMVCGASNRRMFSLVTDLVLLRQKIEEVGGVKLVLIDPISAYLGVGKVDSFRTTDVRAVLAPLVDLAAEFKIAIIGIMHFNKKVDVTNALLRISDSLAFGATARHVYAVVDDPENKRKLVVRGKNNLARHNVPALAYDFGVREVGIDPETGEVISAPHIRWHPEHVDVTASEAMQAATGGKSPAARDEAKKFLAHLLSAGPVPKSEIEEAAKASGIAERTLRRAKTELGVIARKDGDRGVWTWRLSKDDEQQRNWPS